MSTHVSQVSSYLPGQTQLIQPHACLLVTAQPLRIKCTTSSESSESLVGLAWVLG